MSYPIINRIRYLIHGRFQKQVATQFTASVLYFFLSFMNGVIIARVLGPAGKGEITIFVTFAGFISLFVNAGIPASNVYLVGSKQKSINEISSSTIALAFLLAIIGDVFVVIFMLTGWLQRLIPSISTTGIILVLIYFPLLLIASYLTSILQGLQKILQINIFNIVNILFVLFINLVLIFLVGFKSEYAMSSLIAAQVIVIGLISRQVKKEGGNLLPKVSSAVIHPQMKYGLRGYIGNLFQFFNYRLDSFVVNYFLGPSNVGIYSVSVALAGLLWYFPNAVSFVIFPNAAARKKGESINFPKKVFYTTMIFTFCGAIGLALVGKYLITLFYSSSFTPAYIPLLALLPGTMLFGGTKILANEMAGRGYPEYNSFVAGVSLVITIILDFSLIPTHGILGAAFASSISYSFSFVITCVIYLWLERKSKLSEGVSYI
jgi:O-antigen/teichoic acid export membrane protein